MTDDWINNLYAVLRDNTSGSGELLDRLLSILSDPPDAGQNLRQKQIRRLRDFCLFLRKEQKDFFILQHFATRLLDLVQDQSVLSGKTIKAFVTEYLEEWRGTETEILKRLTGVTVLKGKTILLHSNSSVITEILRLEAEVGHTCRIVQTESRPVFEGRIQGIRLAEMGHKVTVISDASVSRNVEQVDLALLGADAVFEDVFINKAGSHMIALLCQAASKPLYVLCDSRKLWSRSMPGASSPEWTEHPKPEAELWPDAPPGISVQNYYFEKIPNHLVTQFIFEDEAAGSTT